MTDNDDLCGLPTPPGAQYEWMGVSEALREGLNIEALIALGWEFCGGALRRPIGAKE